MTEKQNTAAAGDGNVSGRPARPERPPGYWERIDAIVDAAPPLTDLQRIKLRGIFQQATERREAA